jgi:hypothetical protein
MPRTLTVLLLFLVCALAAAAGGYVAVRQSSSAAAVATVPAAPQNANNVTPAQATTVTEAVIPEPAATAPDRAAAGASSPVTPEPAAAATEPSTVTPRPAPAPRTTSSAGASSRPVTPPSNAGVSYRPTTPVAAGVPVAEQPAQPTQTSQVSAPPDPPQASVAPPPPPVQAFEEVVVPAESVLGLQVMTTTSTEEARVEDRVEAKVTRDVRIGRTVAIPAGTLVLGVVTVAERGGKVKGKARLGVRFHTLVLADAAATRVPIRTDTVFRESESQGQQSAAKIGAAAAGGAILGAIIGGGKGAAIGGAIGAGGGTANVMRGERSVATLQAGTPITVRLQDAVTVTIER